MSPGTAVELALIALVWIGLIITCIIDPAGLVDTKYGKREEGKSKKS